MLRTMTDAPFSMFQNEIYFRGIAGERPALPMTFDDLQAAAEKVMSEEAYGYVAGSAGSEATAAANRAAFDRWRILPRMLRGVATRTMQTSVLGTAMPAPVMLGPVGVQGIVHPDAELAVARAASALGLPFCLSTVSSYSLEEVAEAAGDGPRWFQLYWPKDVSVRQSLLKRAEAAGYGAIVVTLDTMMLAWRPRDLRTGYLPFLQRQGLANYFTDPAFQAGLAKPVEDDPMAAVGHWIGMFGNPEATWEDLVDLRADTSLPMLVKGILDPEDARRAIDCGVDGIVVSNHGGRQVDGSIAALDALPRVVEAVGGAVPVLLDSGVRGGSDIAKAVCLGAAAVLIARPWVYGLGIAGEEGVRHVLRCVLAELDLTMALSGRISVEELNREMLVPAP
ncbi:MAG: lactate 2-monooxygenase [Frankiales bacterium]|nr:lactate 2-monooxygenase [Frankiales bacterium]